MSEFQLGYEYFQKQAGIQLAAIIDDKYLKEINDSINILIKDLNKFEGYKTQSNILKGDIAEFWHADTFNINAIIKGSENKVYVDRSHDFSSPDISSNFSMKFGLKYYKNGIESAKAQSKSVFERFNEYKTSGGKESLVEYLKNRGYEDIESVLNDPIYTGQVRIIPREQLEMACDWLKLKIAKESMTRPEQVFRYKETLEMISNKIKDGSGTESIALSNKDAEILANLSKNGNIDAEILNKLGVSTKELLNLESIAKESFKAGISAAIISMVLEVSPEIYKALEYLINTGQIDKEQFKKIGFDAMNQGTKSFLSGCISAALTSFIKTGYLGESIKNIPSSIIGMTVVLSMNVMQNAFMVANKTMTKKELSEQLIKDLFISCCSTISGEVTQSIIKIPVLGFMIGSFIGSVIGSFAYNNGCNAILSFCIDTGFTMFGLVDQDYTLPDDVLEYIGIDVFNYQKFTRNEFVYDEFKVTNFNFERFNYSKLNYIYLRRGVIGVSKVGFL